MENAKIGTRQLFIMIILFELGSSLLIPPGTMAGGMRGCPCFSGALSVSDFSTFIRRCINFFLSLLREIT